MTGEQGTRDIQCYKDTFLTNEHIFTQQRHLSGVIARSRERKKIKQASPRGLWGGCLLVFQRVSTKATGG